MAEIDQEKKENFNVIGYLEDRGIQYWTEGNNVSRNWIGIKCVYCDDTSNHMGINLINKRITCWKCREEGDVIDLVRAIEKCSFGRAVSLVNSFQDDVGYKPKEISKKRIRKKVLPSCCKFLDKDHLPKVVKSYLKRRGFKRRIIEDYSLGFCKYGDYNLSIIAPIFVNREIVSYQAIDATGKASTKYIDAPKNVSIIPNSDLVYGVDDIMDQMCIVEGVTDKWAMGLDSVATLTKNYSKEQLVFIINYISKKTRIKILFDPDASRDGKRFANELCCYYTDVLFIKLYGKDPAELSIKDRKAILRL